MSSQVNMRWVVNVIVVKVTKTLFKMEEALLQGQTLVAKRLPKSMTTKICQELVWWPMKDNMKARKASVQKGQGIMGMGTLLVKVVKVEGETLVVKRMAIIRIMKMRTKLVGRMVKAMLKLRRILVQE
jgi:hypothetical protein